MKLLLSRADNQVRLKPILSCFSLSREAQFSAVFQRRTRQILLEEVERSRQEEEILHQERDRQIHGRKSARFRRPCVGEKRDDGDGAEKGDDRAKRANDAEPSI